MGNPSGWVVRVEVPGEYVKVLPHENGVPFPDSDSAIKAAEAQKEELEPRFPGVEVELSNKVTPRKKV
ncbi:hypothetical protein MK805_09670 [Shimazuella sp. AN120528]|nr:hypothetical protein [Shimazuella soli]